MGYCVKCGAQVSDTMNFCPVCGAKIPERQEQQSQNTYEYNTGNQTYYTEPKPKAAESGMDRFLAVLSYLGALVIVPILAGNNSKFVKHHANQGLVLFIIKVVWRILDRVLSQFVWFMDVGIISIGSVLDLMELGFLVLTIIGIVNACRSEEKELPIIGGIILFK